jgi:C4-dicarboxylate-specific signal transduction histidine kinase
LQNWHSNAVATEKLTSLGMLASGMAHEINTP